MRAVTTIVAFVLVMAIAVLPALSNPLLPIGPNGRPAFRRPRIGIPIKPLIQNEPPRLSTFARRELRQAKRIIASNCFSIVGSPQPSYCRSGFNSQPFGSKHFIIAREVQNAKRVINLHCSGNPATIPADCFDKPPRPTGGLFGKLPLSIKTPIAQSKRFIDLRCSGLRGPIPADCQNRAPPKPLFPGGPVPLELRALAAALA